MTDRHRIQPIAWRPTAQMHERLMAFVADTGTPVRTVITEAVRLYLAEARRELKRRERREGIARMIGHSGHGT